MNRYSFPENYSPLRAHYGLQDNGVPMPYGGMAMVYVMATQFDALALYDAAVVRTKRVTHPTVNDVQLTEVTYPIAWQVPFVKERAVHNCTVTFGLHQQLNARNDLSKVRNTVHAWVLETLCTLEQRRARTSHKLDAWRKPKDYAPIVASDRPLPAVLQGLWQTQRAQRKLI